MVTHKSKLHANTGLLLALLIGFGFGAFLFMQSKSIENHQSDLGSSSAVESMPGMDMDAHEMEEAGHGTEEETAGHGTEESTQDNSPVALLLIFLGVNVALIVTGVALKRVRSKTKVLPRESAPILELEGGTK